MEFMNWFSELNAIAISKGFANAGDPEKWHGEFNQGMTPQQAWDVPIGIYIKEAIDGLQQTK